MYLRTGRGLGDVISYVDTIPGVVSDAVMAPVTAFDNAVNSAMGPNAGCWSPQFWFTPQCETAISETVSGALSPPQSSYTAPPNPPAAPAVTDYLSTNTPTVAQAAAATDQSLNDMLSQWQANNQAFFNNLGGGSGGSIPDWLIALLILAGLAALAYLAKVI